QTEPRLWSFVADAAQSAGVAPPEHLVLGLEPNFYVTEAHVQCLDGELHGRTMYLSIPLARIFSQQELRAVLGHELGHYKGDDTVFSQKFYPIYRGTLDSLTA